MSIILYFMKPTVRLLAGASLCAIFSTGSAQAQTNIALGKTVTPSTPSNYALTKDKNPAQLTDGKYASAAFNAEHRTASLWIQPGSITWRVRRDPIVITIDLEKIVPISGLSLSTAAGAAGVQFPAFAGVAVSDDGKTWHYQGNLINLSRKNGVPAVEGYSKFRFTTRDLQTKGRYIALSIQQTPYTVTDEIEVYSGDEAWLARPVRGKELADPAQMKDLAAGAIADGFVQRRLDNDINTLRKLVDESSIPVTRKSALQVRLNDAAAKNDHMEYTGGSGKTILPLNAEHRSIMAVHGELLAEQGVRPLSVWKQHRYDWLPLISKPETGQDVSLDFSLLRNQFRSDALLLTNASGSEKTVQLQLQNPPANAQAGWLQVAGASWTDTYQGIPVADALLPLTQNQGRFEVKIPAGFTSKLWLTVDSSKLAAGEYTSTLVVDGQSIPLRLAVTPTAMQRPRLSLGTWDYTDPKSIVGTASRGLNPKNYAAAFELMKSHYVDSPWAGRSILPWPKATDFDANGQLKVPLDFSDFDKWVAGWPHARNFFIFVNAKEKENFGGAVRGTPAFNARLGNWAKAVVEHLKAKNIDPGKLSLLINDEAGIIGEWQDDVIADWARAIKAVAPELTLLSDPVWRRPDLQKNQDAITLMDQLMPNTQIYTVAPSQVADFFRKQRDSGKDLWLYSCTGPVRMFNPQQYYRGQAWRVFQMGGKGMGFWSFGDIGGAPTTWHDYQISQSFSPAFVDEDTVYSSVKWEAVREGVQDFEELSMLRDAVNSSTNTVLKAEAEAVLSEALKAVTATRTNDFWQLEKNPNLADGELKKVRTMLAKFKA